MQHSYKVSFVSLTFSQNLTASLKVLYFLVSYSATLHLRSLVNLFRILWWKYLESSLYFPTLSCLEFHLLKKIHKNGGFNSNVDSKTSVDSNVSYRLLFLRGLLHL